MLFPETKENNYRLGLTLKQKLYAPEVFEAIKASRTYAGQAEVEFEITQADVVKEVKKHAMVISATVCSIATRLSPMLA